MVKLIACDMDGTLLDSQKRLPPGILPVLRALKERGVSFAVASGRQYAALRRDLQSVADDILFICENGALVMERERQVLIDPMPVEHLREVVTAARDLPGVYPVLCRAQVALVQEGGSQVFYDATKPFYPSLEVVSDLRDFCDSKDVCKIAFFDEGDAQTHELPVLKKRLGDRLAVILSGEHWVDVMKPGVTKGGAMRGLQRELGVSPEECMAFGDYLNDLELLESVGESYAMENALPELKAIAKHIAPGNDDDGVLRVIRKVFGL